MEQKQISRIGQARLGTERKRKAPFTSAMALLGAFALGNGIGNTVAIPMPETKRVVEVQRTDGESSKSTVIECVPAKLWAVRKSEREIGKKPESG